MDSAGLIACDLDGTALQSSGRASLRTRSALTRAVEAGWVVAAATGRPREVAVDVAIDAGFEWLVCMNGATTLWLPDLSIVEDHLLTPTEALAAAAAIRTVCPEVYFGANLLDGGAKFEEGIARHIPLSLDEPVVVDALEHLDQPVRRLNACSDAMSTEALIELVAPHLPEGTEATHSGLPFLEVGPPGVSKASALDSLRRRQGVRHDDTVVFGDGINDHAMLQWAARGIAMANASEATRALADEVTVSNDEQGVAVVIEQLLDA